MQAIKWPWAVQMCTREIRLQQQAGLIDAEYVFDATKLAAPDTSNDADNSSTTTSSNESTVASDEQLSQHVLQMSYKLNPIQT
jgi:hypothetical protein